jgi:hypothetical protein
MANEQCEHKTTAWTRTRSDRLEKHCAECGALLARDTPFPSENQSVDTDRTNIVRAARHLRRDADSFLRRQGVRMG